MDDPIDRPKEEDPWNEYDEEIAALLALLFWNRFSKHSEGILSEVDKSFLGKGDINFHLWELSGNNHSLLNLADEDAIAASLRKSFASGSSMVSGGTLSSGERATVDQFVHTNVKIIRRYADTYFDSHVVADILEQVNSTDTVLTQAETKAAVLLKIQEALSPANPYWSLLSGQAAVRTHNYGILKTAKNLGISGYRLVAVIDSKTTRLCRSLHGREFWVSDGIARYESIIGIEPSSIASAHPWINSEMDVTNMSNQELISGGILVPPFHAYCRTTLQPI